MSPAALALPAPLCRGLLLFQQHFGGGGEAGAPRGTGRRVPGAWRPASLVQPRQPGGGGHSGRLSQCLHSSPLLPWQGHTRRDVLRKACGLSSETLP